MERSKSAAKEKTIAVLDGVLTVALIVLIFCSVIYPIVFLQKSSEKFPFYGNNFALDREMSETFHPSGMYNTFMEEKKELNGADIVILTIAAIFGLISVLAAVTLFMSTNPRNSPERKLQMTRYWMHCNLFTITLSIIEFFAVFIILDNSAKVFTSILAYIGFRLFVTFVIRDSLSTMSPKLIATVDPDVLEEKAAQQREDFKNMDWYRCRMYPYSRSLAPRAALPLGPYRGDGISTPNCQCIAPQKV